MVLPFFRNPGRARLREHREDIKRCQGAACFAELVRAFGTDSSNELERKVDGRETPYTKYEEPAWSGKYRKWLDGRSPHDSTISLARAKSNGVADLGRWKYLVLWELLEEPTTLTLPELHELMATFSKPILQLLFEIDRIGDRLSRYDLGRDGTLELRDHNSLDAFTALLALAREGELINDDQRHVLPAICAFEIFPKVVVECPQLYVRWKTLFRCLHLTFWSRVYLGEVMPPFSFRDTQKNIGLLRNNPKAKLIGMSAGRRDIKRKVPKG